MKKLEPNDLYHPCQGQCFPEQYHATTRLEQSMGSYYQTEGKFSVNSILQLDEEEAFPDEFWGFLNQWGLSDYYVPVDCGGKLNTFDEVFSMIRAVSRRDLTVAIGHGKTYLGAVCVWVGGSKKQKQRLGEIILDHYPVSFGLTEKDHGSDLSASDTEAIPNGSGYQLNGEKWLINNATRGRAITVFAKTDKESDSRSHSLFIVDKHDLPSASFEHLPKVRTHGIRGADISGIRFTKAPLADSCLIGQQGAGLEITLKSLQITRTMCASLSLGCADAALKTTLNFAQHRQLYGKTLLNLPHAQKQLLDGFLDILICDCVATSCSRALHTMPEQMSVYSSAVKYFVPTTVEEQISDLSVILGARHYLRESNEHGVFQKILRDSAIVSLFDGSTVVNLQAIAMQLQALAKQSFLTSRGDQSDIADKLQTTFNLHEPLETFDSSRLSLLNRRGKDSIVSGLDHSLAEIQVLQTAGSIDIKLGPILIGLVQHCIALRDKYRKTLVEKPSMSAPLTSESFGYAKDYCSIFAATCCINIWLYNHQWLEPQLASPAWLVCCLQRLIFRLDPSKSINENFSQETFSLLMSLHTENRLFSIVPLSTH